MRSSYCWFYVRFWLFYRLVRLALWLVPERTEDWFLELLGKSEERQTIHEAR